MIVPESLLLSLKKFGGAMQISRSISLIAIATLLISGTLSLTAFATTAKGNATSCSSLATCKYSIIVNNVVAGSASTAAGISGYVGQNFPFSGGSLSFILPGEALTSNDFGVYSGWANNTGVFTSTAGLIYHIVGKFAAPDYNTGKIVFGSTHGYVGIKGVGRGSIAFILVNGSISFSPSSLYATVLTVTCNPTSLYQGLPTKCTAIVTNLLGSGTVATGKVVFSSSLDFSSKVCVLSGGICSLNIYPVAGTWPVYASYSGDGSHYKSTARGPELYVGCNPDEC
jgi:hypothetical protein